MLVTTKVIVHNSFNYILKSSVNSFFAPESLNLAEV